MRLSIFEDRLWFVMKMVFLVYNVSYYELQYVLTPGFGGVHSPRDLTYRSWLATSVYYYSGSIEYKL